MPALDRVGRFQRSAPTAVKPSEASEPALNDVMVEAPQPRIRRTAQRARWYLNRLYCMTPREIAHRAVRAFAVRMERARLEPARVPTVEESAIAYPWIHVPAPLDARPYLEAAERIASGRFDIFALRDVHLGAPPRWNRDPRTGREAPLRFGKLIDYRDVRLVGDIKYLWEPNRHAHVVTLAQAYALSADTRFFDALRTQLESWFEACPYRLGPNWSSALEVALRLISWSSAWQLVGGARSPGFRQPGGEAFRRQWLESVYRHAEFIHGHFSLYSSANNHLIGEAAGLFIAGLTWPCWPCSSRWQGEARRILEREIALQNAPDGVNLEQATAYQRFVLELLMLCSLAAQANGCSFSPGFRSRLVAMLEFLASIVDAGGNVPMIGDADDANVLPLDPRPQFCGYRSLLATGAVLFGRHDFARKAARLDDRTRWLVKDAGTLFAALDAVPPRPPARQAFPDGGYYILGCDFETEDEIRLLVDAGPLGYQAIAAHGHADALSFTLSVGGVEIFIDPGTYAYHTQAAWRRYFRGTAAHNTVRIDGEDQSVAGGNFMWVKKARAGCSLWRRAETVDCFEGWHDGYTRLPDRVMHRRRVTLDKRARKIVVEDMLEMSGAHDVELFFHCGERCQVDRTPDGYRIGNDKTRVMLRLPPPEGAASAHCGGVDPILGWVSRRFDVKQPTTTVRWHSRLRSSNTIRSEILCA